MRFIVEHLGTKHDLTGLLFLLFFSAFGFLYKNIHNILLRKWIGTVLGFLMTLLFFGVHLWHFVLVGASTIFLIIRVGPKKCHHVAFAIMFTYITVFRIVFFWDKRKDEMQNLLLMMLTLKIVGVAFEIHAADRSKQYPEYILNKSHPAKVTKPDSDQSSDNNCNDLRTLDFLDLFHYSFSYLGLLTGPYFRYQVYEDFILLPFSRKVNNLGFVSWKLLLVFFFTAVQLSCQSLWPLEYLFDEEYTRRHLLYKLIFASLQWLRFKFFIYLGLAVAECISGAAGLGAYPEDGNNTTSRGPTDRSVCNEITSQKEAKVLKYDFKTIQTIKILEYEMAYTLVDSVRVWNMSIQYWLAIYIYKNIPKCQYSKLQRAFLTIMVSAVWHSLDVGIIVSVILYTAYLNTEQVYLTIMKGYGDSWVSRFLKTGMWLVKFLLCPVYMMPFLLENVSSVYLYFSSVYFIPILSHVIIHYMGILFLTRIKEKCN